MAATANLENIALGCLLGALAGDAAGATLEFLANPPTAEEVRWAMAMSGGGVMQVAPGQITDDGELTLSLLQALAESQGFDLEAIARSYARWIESEPFDIGITTSSSLGSYASSQWQDVWRKEGYAAVMQRAAATYCMESKANGSLMRAAPLGVWGYRLEDEELARYAMLDSQLSHPNLCCGYAVACYAIAIATLMQHPGERKIAFNRAKSWLESQAESDERTEVSEWFQDAENNRDIPYAPQIGFVKIAFTHAFRHLYWGTNYESAIAQTLAGGGDTDTNACIVGGLIGAAEGIESIPAAMRKAVIECDTHLGQNPRPDFLHPSQVPERVKALIG